MRTNKLIVFALLILATSFSFGVPLTSPVPSPIDIVANISPKLGVDDYRKALTQKEVALALVRLGKWDEAEKVMASIEHYSAPSTIAEAILVGWEKIPVATACRWFELADKKMIFTVGRDSLEPTTQLSRLWIALKYRKNISPQKTYSEPKFLANYPPKLQDTFRGLLEPSGWTRFLNRLNPRSPWAELAPKHTHDEKKSWKEGRITDGFTGRILMAEAIRRASLGEKYPSTWITFVIGGMDGTSFNSDPVRLAVDSYRLAMSEQKTTAASDLAARLRIMLPQTTPTAFGAYEAAMLAALACGADGTGRDEIVGALKDLQVRADKYLNEYEKMMVYPQLGAGFVALGKPELGTTLFQQVINFADKNRDPESKRIGLIRLELGLALASMTQSPEEYKKIVKILADADQG
ncbi:MAG: hypothetical protein NTU87_00885 [Verrucomicrobia bacterium]|nr:hypothetical protein [Verrucomicrobiota bacterium]